MRKTLVAVATSMILAVAVVSALAATKPASITIPKYTVIPIVLDDSISTKYNKTGDKFEVHCVGPDCGGFPSGTTFVGVLTVTPAMDHDPGYGSAKFTHAMLPDQRKIQISAEPCNAEGVKNEGTSGGKSQSKARKTGTAIGVGLGALVAGGHGGAVVGGAVGYVAGGASKGKGKDVEIKAGSKGYLVILSPVTIKPKKT